MLGSLVFYSLSIWFVFFLVNYAEIFSCAREAAMTSMTNHNYSGIVYLLQCPLCFAFWTMLAGWIFFDTEWPLVLSVPPVVLFYDLVFNKLRDGCDFQ